MVIEKVETWLTLNREHEEFRESSFVLIAHLLLCASFLFFLVHNTLMKASSFMLVLGSFSACVNFIGVWLLKENKNAIASKWLSVMIVVMSSLLYIANTNGHNNEILAIAFTLVVPVFVIFVLGYRVGSIVAAVNFFVILYICDINSTGWVLGTAETYRLMHLTTIYFLLSAISYFYDSGRRRVMTLLKLSNSKLQHLSVTDALTQLPNRYYLEEKIINSDDVRWIVVLDVDNFKLINDTYGHDKGDDVLQKVARQIQTKVGQDGVACRWGGEEFLIAFYTQEKNDVVRKINELQQEVKSLDCGLDAPITFSCGCAYLLGCEDYKRVFRRADEALYLAKKAGKNCFKFDTSQTSLENNPTSSVVEK